MSRAEEERLVAYVMLVVAGMAAVAWYAWIVTAARPPAVFSLFVLGSVAMVVVSISVGPLVMVLGDRFERDWAMIARQLTLALVVGTGAGTGYVLLWPPDAAILTAGTALAVVAFWAIVPLAVGATSATTGGTSMLSVAVAWPGTNLLALAIFAAPTPAGGIDFARGNVVALDEPARTVGFLLIAGVVTLGPTLLGRAIDRFVYVDSPEGG